jgi:AcrR family transcriptional regulator
LELSAERGIMKKRGQGRVKLIEAAQLEFEEHGYESTNSNAIAKRAGYAPQTFYRHFEDKKAIFLAVYHQWAAAEAQDVSTAGNSEAITDALIRHHKTHRVFRRSLRALTVSDPEVGQARATARLEQITAIAKRLGARDPAVVLAGIFKIERLCDAIADGEFTACGFSEDSARIELLKDVHSLLSAQTRMNRPGIAGGRFV